MHDCFFMRSLSCSEPRDSRGNRAWQPPIVLPAESPSRKRRSATGKTAFAVHLRLNGGGFDAVVGCIATGVFPHQGRIWRCTVLVLGFIRVPPVTTHHGFVPTVGHCVWTAMRTVKSCSSRPSTDSCPAFDSSVCGHHRGTRRSPSAGTQALSRHSDNREEMMVVIRSASTT